MPDALIGENKFLVPFPIWRRIGGYSVRIDFQFASIELWPAEAT